MRTSSISTSNNQSLFLYNVLVLLVVALTLQVNQFIAKHLAFIFGMHSCLAPFLNIIPLLFVNSLFHFTLAVVTWRPELHCSVSGYLPHVTPSPLLDLVSFTSSLSLFSSVNIIRSCISYETPVIILSIPCFLLRRTRPSTIHDRNSCVFPLQPFIRRHGRHHGLGIVTINRRLDVASTCLRHQHNLMESGSVFYSRARRSSTCSIPLPTLLLLLLFK